MKPFNVKFNGFDISSAAIQCHFYIIQIESNWFENIPQFEAKFGLILMIKFQGFEQEIYFHRKKFLVFGVILTLYFSNIGLLSTLSMPYQSEN